MSLLQGRAYAVQTAGTMPSSSLSSGTQNGPLPTPDLSGLDEYTKQLVFASRNAEEGDWEMALEHLHKAEKLKTDDPHLYEMYGVVYDSNRESDKAVNNFKKAGEMYFNEGNMEKALRMLGWLKTFNLDAQTIVKFENKIKERQRMINQK